LRPRDKARHNPRYQPSRGEAMTKVPAYHTNSPEYPPSHRNVYHDHDDCPYGKEIKSWHRVSGTGDRSRCEECQTLG
jgi:hypothetical protein